MCHTHAIKAPLLYFIMSVNKFVSLPNKFFKKKKEDKSKPIRPPPEVLIPYHILPAPNALIQKVVRRKEYKQSIGYDSSKID